MALRRGTLIMVAFIVAFAFMPLTCEMAAAQAYTVSFTVTGLPAGAETQFYVDGSLNGTAQVGDTKALSFAPGTYHTVSVDLYVSGGNGTRYECKDNLWSFTLSGSHAFVYSTQYYFEVISSYGSPFGTDWYDEGTTAYARLGTDLVLGAEGVRYIFARWGGDASGQNVTSEPVIMDGPKKAIALWKTQYSVRISSNPVEVFPSSTSWFDAGAVAELTAPEGTTGIDTRQMFDGWAGDYVGNSTRASIQMDGPKSLVATYKTQYLLSIVILPPDVAQMVGLANRTWCDAQTTAKLGPIPGTVSLSPVEQLISPTWNVDGMIQQGTSVEVFMNRPHHVEVTYRRQYYLEVKSRLGQPTGSGWKDSGETATFGVTYSESDFPVKHTLTGWQSSPQTTITTVGQTTAEVRMDRPYVVEAVWYDDYTPMWLFVLALGAGVAIIVGLVVVHVKRPQYLKSLATSFRSGLKRRKIRSPSVGVGTAVSSVVCHKCGARIPATASFCQRCGASRVQEAERPGRDFAAIDDRVYDYVVKRGGEISLTVASRDLGLPVEELRRSTERLKKKRLLE